MDINLFKDETLPRRTMLVADAQTVFTSSDISGEGLSYEESVNTGEDFTIGAACSASLSFSLKNYGRLIPDLQGKEFAFKYGIRISSRDDKAVAQTLHTSIICIHGDMVYGGFSTLPYLRVWRIAGDSLIPQASPAQPPYIVQSIIISGGHLYCVHKEAGFLSAYSLGMEKGADIPLSPFAWEKVKRYGERRLCLNQQGDKVTEYTGILIDGQPDTLAESVFEYGQVGMFTVELQESRDKSAINVTSYDRMARFDKTIDHWTGSLNYPISAINYLRGLCGYVGVELSTIAFLNADYPIQRNYKGEGVTGRQALQWVAELAAGYAAINGAGQLEIRQYRETDYQITEHEIWTADAADYVTDPVDKLQIRVTETDIGVVVPLDDPSKSNAYIIQNNGLLYTESDAELRPAAQKIYDALHAVAYRPFTMDTAGNLFVRAGDIITVTLDGEIFKGRIMARSWKNGKDALSATGGKRRSVQASPVNQQIQQIRGKTNELVRTVDETRLTMTNYMQKTDAEITKAQTEIKVTSDAVKTKVSQTDYDANNNAVREKFSSVEQTVDKISTTVSGHDGKITKVEQTADALSTTVQGLDGDVSKVSQKVDSITSTIVGPGGTASTQLNQEALEVSFNGISGNGGVQISAAGLKVMEHGQESMRLSGGQLQICDGGRQIGFIGKKMWTTTGKMGLGIDMDAQTFVAFGFMGNGGVYDAWLTLDEGGAGNQGTVRIGPDLIVAGRISSIGGKSALR